MNTQMEKYRATRDFGMGDMTIQRGMAIEFDGYTIRVAGRPPLAMPTFKGAVKAKWAVPEAEYDSSAPLARPQSAGTGAGTAAGRRPGRSPAEEKQGGERGDMRRESGQAVSHVTKPLLRHSNTGLV